MEICSPMMPLGAYIEGQRCISPVLHLPLPGRTLSSPALTKGKSRGTDIFVENCCFMHRDVDRGASLRTDPSIYALYGIICAQRRQSGNASAHRVHIRGCSFGRPSVPDSSLQLRMTIKIAQNDSEDRSERQGRSCRMTVSGVSFNK